MQFVTRDGWGARPARKVSRRITPKGVVVHYNGPAMNLGQHASCFRAVKNTQNFHMDTRKWADIAYSLLVCPHGFVFEGRGVGVRTAANGTDYGNQNYYAVMALLGDGEEPPIEMLRGICSAIEYLRKKGAGPEVTYHSALKATGCPGGPLREWVKAGCKIDDAKPHTTIGDDMFDARDKQLLDDIHRHTPAIRTIFDKITALEAKFDELVVLVKKSEPSE